MLELKNAQTTKLIKPEIGWSVLELALKNQVDWGFSCTRGTCARCRCSILQGAQYLDELTDAEYARLDEQEITQGYRLACQCTISQLGDMCIQYAPYK